ncbi:hypothetical protein H5410_029121 [Solanum commersonii]|uniref:Uncharacterized protein n=1 Tax=Solanum commersonii TaxID=4109 RepID=A0A9J5Z5X1_SOLCO|nr:hypothetical protein H5410_029121 [Solanum commersonii]
MELLWQIVTYLVETVDVLPYCFRRRRRRDEEWEAEPYLSVPFHRGCDDDGLVFSLGRLSVFSFCETQNG